MKCPRCAGLMMQDDYLDLQDEAGQCWFSAWRCLICGEVLDPLILKHRSAPPAPILDRARPHKRILSIRQTPTTAQHEEPAGDANAAIPSLA